MAAELFDAAEDLVDVAGIHAQDARLEHEGIARVGSVAHLSESHDALVGVELDQRATHRRVLDVGDAEVGDFEIRRPRHLVDGLHRGFEVAFGRPAEGRDGGPPGDGAAEEGTAVEELFEGLFHRGCPPVLRQRFFRETVSSLATPPCADARQDLQSGWGMALRLVILAVLSHAAFGWAAEAEDRLPLNERIERALLSEERLRVYDWVEYRIDGSTVTLEGAASLNTLPASLGRLAARVDGVERVDNRLEALPYSRDDMAMRVNAYWRIYGNAELRRYARRRGALRSKVERGAGDFQRLLVQPIHIIIREGHLTLEGEVEQERDARTAEEAANLVMGVRSVTNRLVVVRDNVSEHQALPPGSDPWWTKADSDDRPRLRIENPSGRVRVAVGRIERVRVRASSLDRATRDGDVITDRIGRRMRLRARPEDGARIDVEVDLPYGYGLEVETVDGPVEVAGLLRFAEIRTATGAVHLTAPWDMIRLDVESRHRPDLVEAGDVPAVSEQRPPSVEPDAHWRLVDQRPRRNPLYGRIEVHGTRPRLLRVVPGETPEDAPVSMHWEAPKTLERLFRPDADRRLIERGGSSPGRGDTADPAGVHFSSEVRLVDLTVSAQSDDGEPLSALGPGDFEVIEEGVEQEVRVVEGEETPFNLVLLLDLSTSTLTERFTVMQAARSFVATARPGDRVAVHVMADSYLQVLSPLTEDHESLIDKLEDIPPLSGSTPLYDAIVLSYAKDLSKRRWERNALIVISDGMDNQILPPVGRLMPSKTKFDDLERAAREMEAVIYPILLDGGNAPRTVEGTSWRRWREEARSALEKLAAATGGRLFRAPSFRALTPVYRQVADELRSVYRLGYYPRNQDFDGEWRDVEVRLNRPGARVRTRPGFYAW